MLHSDGFEGRRDGAFEVEPDLVDQAIQSLAAEYGFHFAEDGLDGVQLRAVPDVEDRRDVEAVVLGLDIPALVHAQLVHEERDGPSARLVPQFFEKGDEVFRGDGLQVDEAEAHAALGRHRGDDRPVALVHLPLVHGQVAVAGGPVPARQAQLGEVDLVEEDDGSFFCFRPFELCQQFTALFRVLCSKTWRQHLFVAHPLAPYLVLQVQAAQGRDRDALVRELPVKKHRPLLHGLARPLLEHALVQEEVDVLLAEPAHELIAGESPFWPECASANMLHLVVRHAQRPRDGAVRGVITSAGRGPRAPESEQQHRLAQLTLMLLGQLRKATVLLHHFVQNNYNALLFNYPRLTRTGMGRGQKVNAGPGEHNNSRRHPVP